MKRFVTALLLLLVVSFGGAHAATEQMEPSTINMVQDASYRLYLRISPPGRKQTHTVGFCSASFYEVPEDAKQSPKGIYGTTAGHCLDAYNVARNMLESRVWGMEISLAVSPNNDSGSFVPVEAVTHGMKKWRDWVEDKEDKERPDPENVNDWGVIKVAEGSPVNKIKLAEELVETGDRLYLSGFPYALGRFWAAGDVTYPYSLPGTSYDGYIASDVRASPGNSGSPVVNVDGKQTGILVAGIPGGPSLSTPITQVEFPHDGYTASSARHPGQGRHYRHLKGPVEWPIDLKSVFEEVEWLLERYEVNED